MELVAIGTITPTTCATVSAAHWKPMRGECTIIEQQAHQQNLW